MTTPLPLEGLYLYLVRNGIPLSVRDYQDALAALRLGHGDISRQRLYETCDALWCRTEQDSVLLERVFRELPKATADLVRELGEQLDGAEPPVDEPDTRKKAGTDTAPDTSEPSQTPVSIAAPQETGTGLPRAALAPIHERFIFTPRPAVNLRSLIIAWRRFRLAQRSGPPTEVDIDATVVEHSRRGRVAMPVLVPARRNQARLVVLVDASPSMTPWRAWNPLLRESLQASGFADAPVYYFDNIPGAPDDAFYERDSLTHPVRLRDASTRHPAGALLMISDAGSARGRTNRARVARTEAFIAAARMSWSPVAWVNPMPKARWEKTTAERISRIRGVHMSELTDEGLILAIDYLRGKAVS
jgi:uncharacterized protein